MIYLDHNATTPLLPQVKETLKELFGEEYGNPSSPYHTGRRARDLLEESRHRLAELLGAKPSELIFTSGGTEGNNMVLRQLLFREDPGHLLVSSVEHPSVLETAKWLTRKNIRELARIARERQVPFHSDCVQYAGKCELDLESSGLNYATLTAHKLGGPKGIGLLYIREGSPFSPLITGGGQERSLRAGTENVAMACAFAECFEWFCSNRSELESRWLGLRKKFLDSLEEVEHCFLLGTSDESLPNTLNLGFQGISAESLLICLDLDGIAVSSGSACSSGAMEASHVLLAMGYSHEQAKSSLRISMGWNTSEEDIEELSRQLIHHVKRLTPISGKSDSNIQFPEPVTEI